MKLKRQFQLAAGIIGIVLSAVMLIDGVVALIGAMAIDSYLVDQAYIDALYAGVVMFFVLSVPLLVIGILLCRAGIHKGLLIAMIIVSSIVTLLFFISLLSLFNFITFLILGASVCILVFSIIALSARAPEPGYFNAPQQTGFSAGTDAFYGGQYNNFYNGNYAHNPAPSPVKPAEENLESKLEDLKKLKNMGVITEEQYYGAIDKAVKASLGISIFTDKNKSAQIPEQDADKSGADEN
jgi:hypothetical protein